MSRGAPYFHVRLKEPHLIYVSHCLYDTERPTYGP
jgi:hypothetical protein